jgi:transposase
MDKLKKVTPFLSVLRDKGMTYREIAEILEVLTGMEIDPNRVRNYVRRANPPTVHITITDREYDGT